MFNSIDAAMAAATATLQTAGLDEAALII